MLAAANCSLYSSKEMLMKKNRMLTVPFLGFFFASLAVGSDLPWENQLPFKEATIHYDLKGSQQGSETLYIKDSGKQRAKHHRSSMTIMNITTKKETLELTDPDWVTSYDLVKHTGSKTTNPNKLYRAEYNKLSGAEKKNFEKNAQELGSSMLTQFGGSVQEKEATVAGYACDVATLGGMSTVYLLHGTDIVLRSETAFMGINNTLTATTVDTSTAIPAAAFMPPAGIFAPVNQEQETMMAETVSRVMTTLKRPDGIEAMKKMGPVAMPDNGRRTPALDNVLPGQEGTQQEMMREMQKGMEMLKQMMPQQ
jgi:hypothetical protein